MEYYSSLDASQLDSETPTLFELISAGQLESLLSPSLRYILVHYASKYPYYLLRVNNHFDELNLAFRSFVEWYFFKYWQGSFTENFYGLKRVNQTPISDSKYNSGKLTQLVPSMIEERRALTGFQKAVSIFEVTGVAYISEKLEYLHETWYTKFITNQLNPSEGNTNEENLKINLKRIYVQVFPYLQSTYRAGNLITTLMYLSGKTKSPTLLTYLFNINYSRLNLYDYSKNEPSVSSKSKTKINKVSPPTTLDYIIRLLTKNFTRPSWKVIKFLLGTFFPVAIFSLKFLEWWNNSGFSSKLLKNQGNVLDFTLPPPSTLAKALRDSRGAQSEKSVTNKVYRSGKTCPLCKNELTNPAIIETGYVFDYSCIYNYLEKSHILVSEKASRKSDSAKQDDDDDDDDDEDVDEDDEDDGEDEKGEAGTSKEVEKISYDINKGGRCPITGRKLLGCKWNAIKEEWDIEGIRRLIF
ncbi:uncharacterized protein CANTADRAFT_49460 [Suhomyces tanzawaensis NRRL Y-17324]|uniref:Peroxisome assembly protein 12 n=1 Tax=Suhomyces tanzawaensis NRRL Y-17324 TaxID=984487 RepID=A0A1E4SJU0_9ASCO|nr:uncharacterized protein CANTADRAFT_49460 [Suhomyces tanzawaensis NRRL Y-17324]ODV79702.1 hypothetical protein CANTADRAFT_49460 [Suhomyces tanzawaensis NRRL Y-17324]